MADGVSGISTLSELARSRLMRAFAIALLVLVLRIPIGMIRGLIGEREARRAVAVEEVTRKWGQTQALGGPVLIVPYEVPSGKLRTSDKEEVRWVRRHASFLAAELFVEGAIETELRQRGIFEIPVYRASLRVRGRFERPDFSGWEVDAERVSWDRALLSIGISDTRVIQDSVQVDWNGRPLAFQPGPGPGSTAATGIHAPLSLAGAGDTGEFAFELPLHGSGGLYFVPFGRHTSVSLSSDWPHPSFQGHWLPSQRSVGPDGFEASWEIPSLGRNYPQRWTSADAPSRAIEASSFGVNLVTPIDPYRLAQRSIKYDALFVGLTFVALWLFEVLAGVRVHAIQYLLVGGAMTLFYLLELSFAEHVGFAAAYAVASTGVVALIACYAVAILREKRRGAAIGGLVAALYAYLYVLLQNQDYALLAGSIGLFAMLAAVMWLTRRVDWYAPAGGDER